MFFLFLYKTYVVGTVKPVLKATLIIIKQSLAYKGQ